MRLTRHDLDDSVARLVYADWLEDHDEPERAALIRAADARASRQRQLVEAMSRICNCDWSDGRVRRCGRCWDIDKAKHAEGVTSQNLNLATLAYLAVASREFGAATLDLTHGLVTGVTCDVADWMKHGPAWVRRHPVGVVRFADRDPALVPNPNCWAVMWCNWTEEASGRDDLTELPPEILRHLAATRTAAAALNTPGGEYFSYDECHNLQAAVATAWREASEAALLYAEETEP